MSDTTKTSIEILEKATFLEGDQPEAEAEAPIEIVVENNVEVKSEVPTDDEGDLPISLEKKAFIFNKFYFDLIKKIKTNAKQQKETSKDARNILRAIKNSYSSYETGSTEYIQKLTTNIPESFWKAYHDCNIEEADKFLSSEDALSAWLYNSINVSMISSCMNDKFIIHHYLVIFVILLQDASSNDINRALELLKSFKDKEVVKEISHIKNTTICRWVIHLHSIYTSRVSNIFNTQFSDIESTSIGKLAKEIMDEVDMSGIQNSLSGDGDIFKALADPNSGIASLLGTVSQKMIGKLASGEIRQENLLQDAMKFATKLPGMLQGGGGAAGGAAMDLSKMATMMQSVMGGMGGMGKSSNDSDNEDSGSGSGSGSGMGNFDIGSIAQMFQGMMGGQNSHQKKPSSNDKRAVANSSAAKTLTKDMRRSAMVQKIRNKMEKNKLKENITDQ
jgi:hypothetical protein